jgi:peroxiredoxin
LRAPLLLLSAILLGGSALGYSENALVNRHAPAFARVDLHTSQQIHLSDYRGKVVLLNFWATWCAPCLLEMPRFVAWQRQYGKSGLQVLGVSMDDDDSPVRSLDRKLILNYPVVMGDEKLGELYGGVLGLPVTYLVDRNGVVRARFQGETDLDKIEEQLKLLLSAPRATSRPH